MQELAGKSVLVLGLGVSGRSAANFCAARGARVTGADEERADRVDGLDELDSRVERSLGRRFPDPADFDLVVPSPGVPGERYRGRARRVWGDLELVGAGAVARSINPATAVAGRNFASSLSGRHDSPGRSAAILHASAASTPVTHPIVASPVR